MNDNQRKKMFMNSEMIIKNQELFWKQQQKFMTIKNKKNIRNKNSKQVEFESSYRKDISNADK